MDSSSDFELETFSSSSPPLHISIPPIGLNPPVAPPSPFFAGINEDINTEPFPEFDFSASLDEGIPSPSPLHCAFHCDKKVCRRQRRKNRALAPCTCLSDSFSTVSIEPPSPQPDRPPLTFLALDDRSHQQALLRRKSPDAEIEIHLTEAQAHLQHLKIETIAQVLRSVAFMEVMREAFPDREIRMAVITVEQFFDTMSLYFERTVPLAGSRTVVLEQLWIELDVYIWTMLRDWIARHCDGEEQDRLLRFNAPDSIQLVDSGAPAAVLGLWRNSAKALVEALVWRDDEVKNRHDRTLMWVILGSMFFLFVVWP